MSLRLDIDKLSDDLKKDILNDIPFRVIHPKTQLSSRITPYHVCEQSNTVSVPLRWGVDRGLEIANNSEQVQIEFPIPLREYQKNIAEECIEILNKSHTIILSLHVGWGKSIFALYLASKFNLPTIILVNRIVLGKQWVETVKLASPKSKVEFITCKTKNLETLDCEFYVANAVNVPKLSKKFTSKIGFCIVDEVHLFCAKSMYSALFHIHPKYSIGLSATPYRTDGMDKLLDLYFGNHKIIQKLDRNHLVNVIDTKIKIAMAQTVDGKVDWNKVLEAQATNPTRNNMIADIVKDYPTKNFLILVKRVAHGRDILRILKDRGENVDELLGNSQKFDRDCRILVATASKVGVGFSHDKLDALILASDIEAYAIQYIGRVFRTTDVEPIIFDLVDNNPILRRHYETRERVYLDIGGRIERKSIK